MFMGAVAITGLMALVCMGIGAVLFTVAYWLACLAGYRGNGDRIARIGGGIGLTVGITVSVLNYTWARWW